MATLTLPCDHADDLAPDTLFVLPCGDIALALCAACLEEHVDTITRVVAARAAGIEHALVAVAFAADEWARIVEQAAALTVPPAALLRAATRHALGRPERGGLI